MVQRVNEGILATRSAAVAAVLVALAALADEIRARIHIPRWEFVGQKQAFSASRATIGAARTG